MDDRDLSTRDLVYRNVARLVPLIGRIREEEQVAAVECWLHGTAARGQGSVRTSKRVRTKYAAPKDDDNWRLRIGYQPETLPHHKSCREHGREIQDLE